MSPEIKNMDLGGLVDLLAQETQKFTQLSSGSEYEACRELIRQIQSIIESRKTDLDQAVEMPPGNFKPADNSQVSSISTGSV